MDGRNPKATIPRDGQWVLVTVRAGHYREHPVHAVKWWKLREVWRSMVSGHFLNDEDITVWRPMPEPYVKRRARPVEMDCSV